MHFAQSMPQNETSKKNCWAQARFSDFGRGVQPVYGGHWTAFIFCHLGRRSNSHGLARKPAQILLMKSTPKKQIFRCRQPQYKKVYNIPRALGKDDPWLHVASVTGPLKPNQIKYKIAFLKDMLRWSYGSKQPSCHFNGFITPSTNVLNANLWGRGEG